MATLFNIFSNPRSEIQSHPSSRTTQRGNYFGIRKFTGALIHIECCAFNPPRVRIIYDARLRYPRKWFNNFVGFTVGGVNANNKRRTGVFEKKKITLSMLSERHQNNAALFLIYYFNTHGDNEDRQ